MKEKIFFSRLAATAIASTIIPLQTQAQENGDKLQLEFGYLSSKADTQLRVDSANGNRGTSVDLEDDLGLEKAKQINRFNLRYRFNDKHSLKYGFFQLDRAADWEIKRSIVIGDPTFVIDTSVTTGFDYGLHSISYGYSLHADEESHLDVLAGVYYIQTEVFFQGEDTGLFESLDAAGPLPLIGINYEKELTDQWNFNANATLFSYDIGDYDGTLLDTRFRVDYEFTDRLGLGLAYNWQKFDAGVDGDAARGEFDMTLDGVEIALVLRF